MKTKTVYALFAVIGLGITIGSGILTVKQIRFSQVAKTAQGTVVDIERVRSSKGRTNYAPVVSFEAPSGEVVRFRSSMSSSVSRYGVGDKLEVLYDPADPGEAEIHGFMNQWMASIITAILGLAFLGVGGISLAGAMRRKALCEKLQTGGIRLNGANPRVEVDTSMAVNRRNPYIIKCEAEYAGSLVTFKSDRVWNDPTEYLANRQLTVFVDQQDPKKYCLDISFLPPEVVG